MNEDISDVADMVRNADGVNRLISGPPTNDAMFIVATLMAICANICDRLDKLVAALPVVEDAPETTTNGA